MARPCKSAKVLTECSQTKEEINDRIEKEELIRGKADNLVPSMELTKTQLYLFNFIVSELCFQLIRLKILYGVIR